MSSESGISSWGKICLTTKWSVFCALCLSSPAVRCLRWCAYMVWDRRWVPCPQKGHCHRRLLLPTGSRKTGWDIRSSRLYYQIHLPLCKPLDQQKTGGRSMGQGDYEPQKSPTGALGPGSMSDGPKNLNWLVLKTSSLQKFQHGERKMWLS